MAFINEFTRLITIFTIIMTLVSYTLEVPTNVGENPFGNECGTNDDCSCTSHGIPMCYSGYCHCIYSVNVVCADNVCGKYCPSGIGVCFLEKCHCYKLVEDKEATDKIVEDLKPELIEPERDDEASDSKKDNLVPTLLK